MRARVIGSVVVGVWVLAVAGPASPQGQQMYIYPERGQSAQQQQRDSAECHAWAVQQTGFDPTRPQVAQAPPPPAEPPQGGVVRGGARGAAVGAVGGAIAGDAGKGAAIGAATGALIGGMRRADQARRQEAQAQQYQQQTQAATAQQSAAYQRAMSACLSGRGYTVR
jgi:hypothetical protein